MINKINKKLFFNRKKNNKTLLEYFKDVFNKTKKKKIRKRKVKTQKGKNNKIIKKIIKKVKIKKVIKKVKIIKIIKKIK